MKPALAVALVLALAALTGCHPAGEPGKTDKIEFVSSSTVDGCKFDLYRNLAYPCSISGRSDPGLGARALGRLSRAAWLLAR